jgi:hypothetical protein
VSRAETLSRNSRNFSSVLRAVSSQVLPLS